MTEEYCEKYIEEQKAKEWLETRVQKEIDAREMVEAHEKALRPRLDKLKEKLRATEDALAWQSGIVDSLTSHFIWQFVKGLPNFITFGFSQKLRNFETALLNSRSIYDFEVGKIEPAIPVQSKAVFRAERERCLRAFLEEGHLEFSHSDTPKVSVILVLYNQAELTLQCLTSLVSALSRIEGEVIIIDNASSDQTPEMMKRVSGVRYLPMGENLHFLRAANIGAAEARGEHLLFLNNDAWLDETAIELALKDFEAAPDVIGAVGGMILGVNDLLQEAGSIIWRDGGCAGYGRGDLPSRSKYKFKRVTDYVSGAFLMTPRTLWHELGGFDELFTPAYYEEVDYCVRLQKIGRRVVYNPKIIIHHFEFGSSDNRNAVQLQKQNREKFVEKNSEFLKGKLQPDLSLINEAALVHKGPRVLFVDDRVPIPSLGAGFPRANFLVNALNGLGCHVTIAPLNFSDERFNEAELKSISDEIEINYEINRQTVAAFLQDQGHFYDILWVSRPHNMEFLKPILKAEGTPFRVIYDAEALFSVREAIAKAPEDWEALHKKGPTSKELYLADEVDLVVCVSENDAESFKAVGQETEVIGHALDLPVSSAGFTDRTGLLFCGNLRELGSPNVDSIQYFLREVWPLVEAAHTGINFTIVGRCNSILQNEFGDLPNVRFAGLVDDLNDVFNQHRLFIAPTRFAAGIPFKVEESAARGLPVVCSQILARQLNWSEDALATADVNSPSEFANLVIRAYQSFEYWSELRDMALEEVSKSSTKSIRRKLAALLES